MRCRVDTESVHHERVTQRHSISRVCQVYRRLAERLDQQHRVVAPGLRPVVAVQSRPLRAQHEVVRCFRGHAIGEKDLGDRTAVHETAWHCRFESQDGTCLVYVQTPPGHLPASLAVV